MMKTQDSKSLSVHQADDKFFLYPGQAIADLFRLVMVFSVIECIIQYGIFGY